MKSQFCNNHNQVLNDQIARVYSNIESLKSVSMPHWCVCKFNTDWCLSFGKAENEHQKFSVSCVISPSMSNDYIYIHNAKEFDDEIFHFASEDDRLSTKYTSSLCAHSFITYVPNN